MKFVATILIGFLLLAGVGTSGYILYERHLSTEVRAAVVAAVGDTHASDADVVVYLRTAKLAIRTKRDAEVVALFDKAVEQAAASQRDSKASWDLLMDGIKLPPTPLACSQGPSQRAVCQALLEADIATRKHNQELEKIYDANAKKEAAEAKRLIGLLRADVGAGGPD